VPTRTRRCAITRRVEAREQLVDVAEHHRIDAKGAQLVELARDGLAGGVAALGQDRVTGDQETARVGRAGVERDQEGVGLDHALGVCVARRLVGLARLADEAASNDSADQDRRDHDRQEQALPAL
jgi:hypothetical protein